MSRMVSLSSPAISTPWKKKQQQQKHYKNQMRFLTNIACSISVLNILARDHLKHFVVDMKAWGRALSKAYKL